MGARAAVVARRAGAAAAAAAAREAVAPRALAATMAAWAGTCGWGRVARRRQRWLRRREGRACCWRVSGVGAGDGVG